MNNTGQPEHPLISVVIPCYNEAEVFPELCRELEALAAKLAERYRLELIFIDDGSRDATWSAIAAYAARNKSVRGVSLSRNFGHQKALTCGYDLARGDAVVSLDADLQDPPEVVLDLVRKWEEGADIVYAVRADRAGETAFKLWTASAFYHLFQKLGDANAPSESGDFRLMSRRSVEAFRRLKEKHRYLRGMVGWLGFRTATVTYHRRPRQAGQTKYPFYRMFALATDAIISFSSFPLRLSFVFASAGLALVFGYLLYTLIKHLFFGGVLLQGWTSLILTTTIFGSLILISLGIIGEYIGRIYEQVKDRPLYLIREIIEEPEEPNTT